ncbi:hypothetical protein [Clostridium sp.]|uniref:hypothetical protein n=1 Tax=Clostridium sp. TaxID=1506 RepID=UPI0025BAF90F|nr:hypothetical protein [Clostridium sp.]
MEVRERIREYITKGVVKTEGIRKLKREFNLDQQELINLWIEVKSDLDNRNTKRKPSLKPYREDVIEKALKKNGIDIQMTVAIEELGELIQAICKYKRGEEHNIEEEIADVKIMIEQLETIFNKDKIRTWRNKKIERLEGRLKD